MRQFVDAVLIEANSRAGDLASSPAGETRTLYFGGGTPSMLSSLHLERLVNGIYEVLGSRELDEFSFESNPATFTERKVEAWAKLGITRVSLGVQSWDEHILNILGREHTPQTAVKSYEILRRAGIPHINIDLMFSIPGQSLESWQDTLRKTIELVPDHISAYNLTYEEDTAFFEQLMEGQMSHDEDKDADFFEVTHDVLSGAGYRHYETSNFARGNHLSLHNMGYWQGHNYIGLGPGAVSTINGLRIHNTQDTNLYIESTLAGGLPTAEREPLSHKDIQLERIALLLRTDVGIPKSLLKNSNQAIIENLIAEKMATMTKDGNFALINNGRLLTDEIALELAP